MQTAMIVVPCHDESRRLQPTVFRQFVAAQNNVRFLFVNDGSRDNTLAILQGLAGSDPFHFHVLDLQPNRGKAEAVRQGILQAAQGSPDYVGFWDADLATPLDAIPQFVSVLNRRSDISVLLGVRMALLGRDIRRQALRRVLGKGFARAASGALGMRFHDTQCGAKMFRCTPEILAAFSQPFDSRWIFDVEILARLIRMRRGTTQNRLRETVYELPLDYWEDVAGSKLKRGDFFKAVAELGRIWWRYLRPAAEPFVVGDLAGILKPAEQAAPRRAA